MATERKVCDLLHVKNHCSKVRVICYYKLLLHICTNFSFFAYWKALYGNDTNFWGFVSKITLALLPVCPTHSPCMWNWIVNVPNVSVSIVFLFHHSDDVNIWVVAFEINKNQLLQGIVLPDLFVYVLRTWQILDPSSIRYMKCAHGTKSFS